MGSLVEEVRMNAHTALISRLDQRITALEGFRDSIMAEEDDEDTLYGFTEDELKEHDFEVVLPYAEMLADALNHNLALERAIRGMKIFIRVEDVA